MKKYLSILILISLISLVGCSKDDTQPVIEPVNETVNETVNEIPIVNETTANEIPTANETQETGQEDTIIEDINQETNAAEDNLDNLAATTIKITVSGFDPKEATIKKGATVIWTQQDEKLIHAKHQLSEFFREFRSGYILYGGSFNHTFNKTGKYTYIDVLHSMFRGTIVVEE